MKQAELLVINEYCFYELKTKLLAFLTFLTKRGIKKLSTNISLFVLLPVQVVGHTTF